MIEDVRSFFTVLSFLTFIGIVWWAWRPGNQQRLNSAVEDLMNDDDRPQIEHRGDGRNE